MFDLHYAFLSLIRRLPDKKHSFFSYFHGSVLEGQTRNIRVRIAYMQGRDAGKQAWCSWLCIVKFAIIFQHGCELIWVADVPYKRPIASLILE